MVTDVVDESAGRFHIWGNTPEGASVLVRVQDFQPYFYIAGPLQTVSTVPSSQLSQAQCSSLCPVCAAKPPQSTVWLSQLV